MQPQHFLHEGPHEDQQRLAGLGAAVLGRTGQHLVFVAVLVGSSRADLLGRRRVISLSCSPFVLLLVLLEQRRVGALIGLEHLGRFDDVQLRQVVGLAALGRLALHPRVLPIDHLGDFPRGEPSDHGRDVFDIAIGDHALHLLLLLAQDALLLRLHPLLQLGLHLSIDVRPLLPVILLALVVLEGRAEGLRAHLRGNDALVADVQPHLFRLGKRTEPEWLLQHHFGIADEFSLLQHANHHALDFDLFLLRGLDGVPAVGAVLAERLLQQWLVAPQLDLSLSYEEQRPHLVVLPDYFLGNGDSNWLGIVDHELQLIGQEMVEERTLAEHVHLLEVHSLLVQLDDLLEGQSFDHPNHRVVFLRLRNQRPLLPVDELRLPEANALAKRVDLLLLEYFFLVVAALQRLCFVDGQAERDLAFDDHVKALRDFAPVVDDCAFVVELELQVLVDIADELVFLHWVLQDLLEDVQGFEAFLERLAGEVQLHKRAIAVGRAVLLPGAGAVLYDLDVPEVYLLQELLFLHVNYIAGRGGEARFGPITK